MGKASSNKKVQRASRAAGRPGAKKSYVWPASIGLVVLVGVAVIVLSRNGGTVDKSAPRLGDHWHEAYAVYICDSYVGPLVQVINSGIHTHGDGLIHIEPNSSQETGANANVATFVNDYRSGLVLSQTEIKLPGQTSHKDGGTCAGKKANVKIFHWAKATDAKPKLVTGLTKDMRITNNSAITFAFVPDGVTPPRPPSIAALANPNAGEGGGSTPTPAPAQSVPPSTEPTTAPPGDSSTTAKP